MAKLSTGGSPAVASNGAPDSPKHEEEQQAHHYTSAEQMPFDIQKYFYQRHTLFSLYSEGILLTNAAWFGVTPEPIAQWIAHDLFSLPETIDTVIDLFAGAGGNTIALALSGRFRHIFAIERDATTLRCAEHNAALYGVGNKITFIHGDCFDVVKRRLKSVVGKALVFGSPPWGGVEYNQAEVFDVEDMQPYGLTQLGTLAKGARAQCWYLPRSSDLNQLAAWKVAAGVEGRVRVRHYCLGGSSKALCLFVGDYQWDY